MELTREIGGRHVPMNDALSMNGFDASREILEAAGDDVPILLPTLEIVLEIGLKAGLSVLEHEEYVTFVAITISRRMLYSG